MNAIQKACKTVGLSPKVIATTLTGLVVYLVTKLGLQWDPVLEQAVNVLAMIVAGYIAPPGDVVVQQAPDPALVDPAAGDVRPPESA
jgi:hypothetical protein